jgi:UDP-glucose 4-epimerase
VTGGAGFIGSHLVEKLLGQGQRVCVIDDFSTGQRANLERVLGHPDLKVVQGKVSECAELDRLADSSSYIFHLAAAVGVELVLHSPIHTIETNLKETEAILLSAARSRVPLMLASTSEVYGKSRKESFSEEDDLLIGPPHLGRWSYACSKLMDEFLAMAYAREKGLPVTVARLFNTVGPRQTGAYGMALPRFIAAARENRPVRVYGDGTQTRCFCHVTDTVEALVRLQNCPEARSQIFNIGGVEEVSIADLARLVIEIVGSKSSIELVPYEVAFAAGFEDLNRRKPNIDKLARLTGFKVKRSLREIVQSTALMPLE